MNPMIQEERPPYVRFEQRPEEDRNASIRAGRQVTVDVDYAIVTPQGSKDMIPRRVDEWFTYLDSQVKQDRLNPTWLVSWREGYKLWKQGLEIPLEGTPIKTWPVLSPSQILTLQSLSILTVEDLAAANDESLSRIGMGAAQLKQRAQDWLKNASGPGKFNSEVSALRSENAGLKLRLESVEPKIAALEAQLQLLRPAVAAPAPVEKELIEG